LKIKHSVKNILQTKATMALKFNVFRGSPEGKIFSDSVERDLQPHEVFIETTHSGVCGTDKLYQPSGIALGHEGIGVVREVGSGVKTVKVGDRVGFGYTHEICGSCDNCCRGKALPQDE
jgi:D-arabinose 1-dehydrogenase-like Zn-dependent alcohol dehydrogenase